MALGCPLTDLLTSILLLLTITEREPLKDEIFETLDNSTSTAYRTTAIIWKWITERKDVSVGNNRMYNETPLKELLSIARKTPVTAPSDDESVTKTQGDSVKVYISEETMWESLAGHGVDHKRIPKSEWVLLQGIASTTTNGILQGDLGRLVGQDKRSVPKRTSCLVEKGYITKRTTLVRGTKTSKLWLKFLAPSTPENTGDRGETETDITLSRKCLVDNLAPVPWHARWTGESIDYKVLATTIMATCKEWKVMRLQDLKAKLGVLGMTWQMKVVSKICRFLNARGTIQYVAAKLNNRIFKDCIRFNRDMNARDWSIFLATGKRTARSSKAATQEEDESSSFGIMKSGRQLAALPSLAWSLYIPMASLVTICVRESGEDGLTNPQLCTTTIGPGFTRYIAGLTSSMSSENIQPENVKHLTIRSERGRPGKSSSLYWYSMETPESSSSDPPALDYGKKIKPTSKGKHQEAHERYSFAAQTLQSTPPHLGATLTELCHRGLMQQRRKGRPKQIKTEKQVNSTNAIGVEPVRVSQFEFHDDGETAEAEFQIGKQPGAEAEGSDMEWTSTVQSVPARGRPKTRVNGSSRGGRMTSDPQNADDRHFKCSKCAGTWKNDLGLKYHLEKSKTPCNPSFKPQLMATPTKSKISFAKRVRQMGTDPIDDEETSGNTREFSMASNKRSRTGLAPGVERKSGEEGPQLLVTTSARRKQRRISVLPEVMADANVLAGQAELLPSIAVLPPRQVDPFTKQNRQSTANYHNDELSGDIRTSRLEYQETLPDNLEYAPCNLASPFVASTSAILKISEDSERLSSKNPIHRRMENFIIELLHQYSGALPTGQPLELLVEVNWKSESCGQYAPGGRIIASAIQQMIREKVIVDQWHAFRAPDGQIGKCQIVSLPSVPAFAPEIRALVEKIRQQYPAHILPSQIPGLSIPNEDLASLQPDEEIHDTSTSRLESKIGGRGRRSLAADVAVLNAPVYAAQMSAKRNADSEERVMSLKKRRRKQEGPADEPSTSLSEFWPVMETIPPADIMTQRHLSSNSRVTLDIFFKDMNQKAHNSSGMQMAWWSRNNTSQFFERIAGTMPQQGWIEHTNWFSWESAHCRRLQPHETVSLERSEFEFFVGKLKMCHTIEIEAGTNTPLPTTAHNVFLNFIGGDSGHRFNPPHIKWKKFDKRGSMAATTAPSADNDESSSSSSASELEDETHIMMAKRSSVFDSSDVTQALPAPTKRSTLSTRHLTALPFDDDDNSQAVEPANIECNELATAFIVVRSLLGGVDKVIDWGLLVHLFPAVGLPFLRRFWAKIRKEKASFLSKATHDFQEILLTGIKNDEIPMPDYDHPMDYNWKALIQWAMRHPNQEQLQLPNSRERFHIEFELEDGNKMVEDWREKFFHPQSSVFSRFEAVTLQPGALTVADVKEASDIQRHLSTVDIARSWIRSLCCTSETEYTPQDVKERFSSLSRDTAQQSNAVLKAAINQLTRERVICKSKRTPFGGRPYRLNEGYTSVLTKVAHRQKFIDAVSFKDGLDSAFRLGQSLTVPYTLSDGAVMALTNLIAAERVQIKTARVPNIPFGFEPGNYESRKYPKSHYHLDLEMEPTPSYLFNDDIETVHAVKRAGPPKKGLGREIPQWVDFFGKLDEQRWADILGAVCFASSTRGSMSINGICDAVAPILEAFEARIIIAWGLETGVFAKAHSHGITLGEWWWLIAQQPQG